MYLLDTSYLIDLVRRKPEAVKLARKIDEEKAYTAISAITYHEYLLGVYLSHWRNKQKLKEMLRKAEAELKIFDILPYTEAIARKTAEKLAYLIKIGKPTSLADLIIAATAITHKLKLVTRNKKHYENIPELEIITY
ncbi:MAG: type II toxin-antitoxin system VapC family toxin [archaeon GB-1867-035]|nr:type II toxin-antitoxin system VapC family toxin [Candidatus Culexmicrobium profundum]